MHLSSLNFKKHVCSKNIQTLSCTYIPKHLKDLQAQKVGGKENSVVGKSIENSIYNDKLAFFKEYLTDIQHFS